MTASTIYGLWLGPGGTLSQAQGDARYLALAGGTLLGPLQFTGTDHVGLQVNALTTVERDALTPAAGMVVYNTTTQRFEFRQANAWEQALRRSGDTLTGALAFSGANHAGIRLNNLTTTERDALTPAMGMVVYNSTDNRVQFRNNTSWEELVRRSGDTLTGNFSFTEGRVQLPAHDEVVVTPTISSGTLTLNLAAGNVFNVVHNANITTLAFSNVPATGRLVAVTLVLTQDATGGRTLTWPASLKWDGGVAPSLVTTANSATLVTLLTLNGGTTWLGFLAGSDLR